MKNNKCPTCGGIYEFSPKDNALKCKQCGRIEKIATDGKIESHSFDEAKLKSAWKENLKSIKCQNCGANILVDKYAIVNKCSYCGSSALSSGENKAGMLPDAVLPFQFDEKKAKEYFYENISKKMFVPNVVKKQTNELNISSRYISAYLFMGSLDAHYDGIVETTEHEENSKGETKTVVERKHVHGTILHKFDYTIEASTNCTQWEFESITPYNMSKLVPYSPDYLYGHSAEYSDKTLDEANVELEKIMRRDINETILRVNGADRIVKMNINFDYKKKEIKYCLIPAYIFNYDYKKRNYKTLMNGQTGKLGGEIPKSALKITLFVLSILSIVAIIAIIIALSFI